MLSGMQWDCLLRKDFGLCFSSLKNGTKSNVGSLKKCP